MKILCQHRAANQNYQMGIVKRDSNAISYNYTTDLYVTINLLNPNKMFAAHVMKQYPYAAAAGVSANQSTVAMASDSIIFNSSLLVEVKQFGLNGGSPTVLLGYGGGW